MIGVGQLGERLSEILLSASSIHECSSMEFKVVPHKKGARCEFYKDILGLLNNVERPGEDRWLVYGVDNKSHKLIGVEADNPDLLDDASYQQLLDKISPRPVIELVSVDAFGLVDVEAGERVFTAFYIPAENAGEVYEMGERAKDKETLSGKSECRTLEVGMSFYRHGSSTCPMTEEIRCKLRSFSSAARHADTWSSLAGTPGRVGLLWTLGGWHEGTAADSEVVSQVCSRGFEDALDALRGLGTLNPFQIRGQLWTAGGIHPALVALGPQLTDSVLADLGPVFGQAMLKCDGEWGYDKVCSPMLRGGIVRFCACLSNNVSLAPNCTQYGIKNFLIAVLLPVLETGELRVLAHSDELMPLIAEAWPGVFLGRMQDSLEGGALRGLLQRDASEGFIGGSGGGVVQAAEMLARSGEYFAEAVSLLVAMAELSSDAEGALTDLLVPWRPQTEASAGSRKGVGLKLLACGYPAAWRVLLSLLPGVTRFCSGVPDPEFMSLPCDFPQASAAERVDVGRSYCSHVLKGLEGHAERLVDVVKSSRSFARVDMLGELSRAVREASASAGDADLFPAWVEVAKTLAFRGKRGEKDDDANVELHACLEQLEAYVKPRDPYYGALRLFSRSDFELFEGTGSREEEMERMPIRRVAALVELDAGSDPNVVGRLLADGARPLLLAPALAALGGHSALLDGFVASHLRWDAGQDLQILASAYCWHRYRCGGWEEVAGIFESTLPSCKSLLYASLPACPDVWERAERDPGASDYWSLVGPCSDGVDDGGLRFYCVKKGDAGHGEFSVESAARALKSPSADVSVETALCALEALGRSSGKHSDGMVSFYVGELLDFLEPTAHGDRLLAAELSIGRFLEDRRDSYVFKRMTSDGDLLAEVCAAVCGLPEPLSSRAEGEVTSSGALAILDEWCARHGFGDDGSFDPAAFASWIDSAEKRARELGEWPYVAERIGANLFHSQRDGDGFFLEDEVAWFYEGCEEARTGFSTEAVNSRGTCWNYPGGKEEFALVEDYREKALASEERGYLRLAAMLREVASDFGHWI